MANHCRVAPRFSSVLQGFQLHKYRQKNSGAREGARGGWRFYALFDKQNSILYPIVVYPKKEWKDAADILIEKSVKEILVILEQRDLPSN